MIIVSTGIQHLSLDFLEWKERQDSAREALMEEGKREVARALELITRQELIKHIVREAHPS